MARSLAAELTEILAREEYSDDNFMVYADINTVRNSADRASGATLTYDSADHALWRVLNDTQFGLKDAMMEAYDQMAPMTYVPGGIETSRIDVLYVSAALLPGIEAATAEVAGALSKTHLPLGCSFNDQRMKCTAQEKSTEPARGTILVQ